MKKSQIYNIGLDFWINKKYIELVILKITNLSKTQLFLSEEIWEVYINDIKKCFERLKNWEPIEYIINNAEFYSLNFYVDSRVLIPRNDTEIMVNKAIESIIEFENPTLIDIWTWSSCIAISIIKNTNLIKYCYVLDISKEALEVSLINIVKYNLEKKIIQIKSNLLQKLLWDVEYKTSNNIIITANLPYIKNNDFENINNDTLKYEPNLALFWWEKTWFEIYENLIFQCNILKKQNKKIILFIEIGFDQFEYSKKYLENIWLKLDYYKDNCWVYRCIKIKFLRNIWNNLKNI